MIELVLVACLLTDDCKEIRLSYDSQDVSLMACNMYGQAEVARWQQQHQGWQVRSWRCDRARPDEKAI
ncbi:MAG TPA: hypothetical protein VNS22_19565 [Geminicoccus sp.]|uniref:hypothetical protein n=1 Tax=Geminicoccus sp. TaxID=2024832 RepID=UPI002BAECE5F|nr:hypothetical protein [Geminicoccus sp.]HWL70557.1 hypothetical protein [Geminicoccus sp.]